MSFAPPPRDEQPHVAPPPRDEAPPYQYETVAATLEPRIEENLKYFADVTKRIAFLEQHTKELPQAQATLAPLKQQQQALQAKLNTAIATIAKGEEILKGFHPFKNKDEWKGKIAQAQADKAAAEAALPPVSAQIQAAQQVVNSLLAESQELATARRAYARTLSAMFDGASPGYPEEQALEDTASAAYARWVDVATDLPALQNASGHLQKAGALLTEGLQRLQGALGANAAAGIMAIGYGRGTLMEVAQQAQIRASGEVCQAANQEIMIAKQIMPSIPNLQSIQINQQQGLFLFQLMAGGMMMDLVARQRIRESFEYLVGQKQILDGVNGWVANALAQKRGTVDSLRNQLDVARSRLLGKRVAIAEGLVSVKFGESLPPVQMMLEPPTLPVSSQVRSSPAPATVISGGQQMQIGPAPVYQYSQNQIYVQQPTYGSARYDLW